MRFRYLGALQVCLAAVIVICAPVGVVKARNSAAAQTISDPIRRELFKRQLQAALHGDTTSVTAIVFQPLDCSQSLRIIDSLNALSATEGHAVRGYLLAEGAGDDVATMLAAQYDIAFPLVVVTAAEIEPVARMFGVTRTPFLLALDSNGRLRSSLLQAARP